ncbi:MAG: hypothetical protein KIS92_19600 [Planctomycetota bacterium]|nr:hypothetical protein [Planctomycetota bacterium]
MPTRIFWMMTAACACAVAGLGQCADESRSVPSAASLRSTIELDRKKLEENALSYVAAHEKTVMAQFEVQKKKVEEQLAKEEEERQEKIRRMKRYKEQKGDTATLSEDEGPKSVLLRVDFLVPELTMYQRAAAGCRKRADLARSVVQILPDLDRNKDGNLTDDEYRDAGAIVRATERLLRGLDSDHDGQISTIELESTATLPRSALAAARAGASMVTGKDFRIAKYDVDKDGVLDVSERKALSVAYSNAALSYTSEAGDYDKVAEEIEARQRIAAVKFQHLEVKTPTTTAAKPEK